MKITGKIEMTPDEVAHAIHYYLSGVEKLPVTIEDVRKQINGDASQTLEITFGK